VPPTTKYDKERIVEAAFEIAKEHGFSGISTRVVAKRLGCSVAPIYVNFATIEELTAAVVQRVFALFDELMAAHTSDDPFENVGKASLAFAREYPVLFRELALEPNPYMASYEQVETGLLALMAEDEMMREWTAEERRLLLLKMRVFQMGLSAMVATDHMPSWVDEKAVDELLMETGAEIRTAQQLKRRGEWQ